MNIYHIFCYVVESLKECQLSFEFSFWFHDMYERLLACNFVVKVFFFFNYMIQESVVVLFFLLNGRL